MKKLLLLFALVLTVCSMAMAQNYDFDGYAGKNHLYYKIIDEGKHCVCIVPPYSNNINGWGNSPLPKGEIELPETVTHNGTTYTVTQIGACAFYNCDGLTGSLTIPNTVAYIGNEAFRGCSGFTGSLTIGSSVEGIGGYAFMGCSGFTSSLIIPNSVKFIGDNAFLCCSGFTGSLTIPNSVTSIGDAAFGYCSGFTGSLTICSSVESIRYMTFEGCSGFTGDLNIPNSVKVINESAFKGCSGFNGDLIIGNSVKTIDANTFAGCSGFKGSLTIGSSVESIGFHAFSGCSGFTGDLTIPNSVKNIYDNAFENCSGFTGSLIIGNSVESIGGYAFAGCKGFKGSLTIGSSVESIGWYAFSGCSGFTGDLTIPNSVKNIYVNAFENCSGFTGSLIIGNSVESIDNYAFQGCSGFKGDLIIGNSVKSIGDNVFEGCSGFTGSLTIPNSVTSIGAIAFKGCSGFTGSLTIPNSVTAINGDAFRGCSGFTGSLTIPNSVTFIGPYAFDGCSGFKGDLTIGSSVKTISTLAFQGCNGFTNIKVKPATPPKLLSGDAFDGMSALQTITVPYGCGEDYKTNMYNKTWSGYADKITEGIVYDLTVTSSNTDLGTVSITQDATCENNGQATVTATLAEKYLFMNWTEDGKVVSTDNPYTFTLKSDRNLVANFYYTATCTTGQTLYYRIIDAEKHWISIAAPNGDDANGWNGFTKPEGAITLPETIIFNGTSYTVTAIDDYAFCNCDKLTGLLAIPKSVTSIGNHAFDGCSGFTGIKAKPATPPTLGDDAFVGMSALQTITVPYDKVDVYEASWSDYADKIEGGIVYDLTVTSSDTDLGSASITQDATCENNGQVTVTATPAGTNWFAGWTENGKLVSTDNPYTFTLTSDRNLVANFPRTETVSYIDADGQEKTADAAVVENYITTLRAGWYVVSSTDVQTTTLTCDGEVHLILADGAKLTATGTDNRPGIQVSGTGNSLTIYGQAAQSGQLFAKGGYYGAGIGGGWGASGSNITINGGVITAIGSQGSAGIGGGYYGNGSNITINGGVITATGSGYGAGIGGGEDYFGSNITINGGTVTANGGQNASGIGGGEDKDGSNFIFASNIIVDIHSLIKAGGNNPPTTVISNTGADLASSLACKRYVTITEPYFTITANSSDESKGTVSGGGTYANGDKIILTATPAEGCAFKNWSDGTTANPYVFTATKDVTLTATFVTIFNVQASSADESKGSVSGSGIYEEGTEVTLTATPAEYYVFEKWSDGTTANPYVFTPTKDVTLTAFFTEYPRYTITANSSDESKGTVSGGGTYANGDKIILTATPVEGCAFKNWSDGTTANPYVFTATKDVTLTATFVTIFNVQATPADESKGSVTGGGIYEVGAEVTLTATPAENYVFEKWSDGTTANPYVFTATKDVTITALFTEVSRYITDGTEYTAAESKFLPEVIYTRTFDNTNWQALYVPFSIDYEEWSEKFDIAKIRNFIEYDDDDNGTVDRTYLVAIKKASGSTEPNYPYLIRAKEAGTYSLVLKDKTLEAAKTTSIDCRSVENEYTFTGTYTKITDMYANGYYALAGGVLCKAESAGVTLNPQRWYMEVTSRTGSSSTKAQSIQILVDGEEGIESLTDSRRDEGAVVYDLQGRMLSSFKGERGEGPRGISIVNGKKIIK